MVTGRDVEEGGVMSDDCGPGSMEEAAFTVRLVLASL